MMELQDAVFPVEPADYDGIVAVWEASVRATHHFVQESDIIFFRPIVRQVLPELALVCMRDHSGRVVGYAAVGDERVEMLFIHPAWRGRDIGRRLLTHAVQEMGARGLDVNEQNEQAVGFYLKMGFEVEGRSERDGFGKPYPLLHLRLKANEPS